jgi:hypothetical protein
MGRWADMKIIDAFRDYANARINFNIFGQSVPLLQMLEVKVCTSNAKYREDKIDNIKRDLTLGISCFVLRGNGKW